MLQRNLRSGEAAVGDVELFWLSSVRDAALLRTSRTDASHKSSIPTAASMLLSARSSTPLYQGSEEVVLIS